MQRRTTSVPSLPIVSRKWNRPFYEEIRAFINQTIPQSRRRIREITTGLVMPEPSSVSIGSAKRMDASVLFFDLAKFTAKTSQLSPEQTLTMLNLIIPLVMRIARHWNGEIEKNTGDGIMAIFGTETRDKTAIARDAVDAAQAIRFVMLNDVSNKLVSLSLPDMNFRIGIEMGPLLIARIGIPNNSFLTAVGDAANRACKLQALAKENGICIGEDVAFSLNQGLLQHCERGHDPSWSWVRGDVHYPFYHFNHQLTEPSSPMPRRLPQRR